MSTNGSRNNSCEMDIPIAYIPTRIPSPSLYEVAPECMCIPGVTQQEYEHGILNRENPEDELISVVSTTVADGTERTLKIRKSSLDRSSFFNHFFLSDHYLHGCKMQLRFENDLAECFEIVQIYLDKGPDIFTQPQLQLHFCYKFLKKSTRLVVLVKLYALAGKLSLPILKTMIYEYIEGLGRVAKAKYCIILASLIYDKKANSDKRLKKWCFQQISYHFQTLKASGEWAEVVEKLYPELENKWGDLARNKQLVETAVLDGAPQSVIQRMISDMQASSQENLMASMEGHPKKITTEAVLQQLKNEKNNRAAAAMAAAKAAAAAEAAAEAAELGNWDEMHKMRKQSEDSWEDFESMASCRSGLFVSSKARDILGMDDRGAPGSRSNNNGESSVSTASAPSKSRAWPFWTGRDESKAKEESGPESGLGLGIGVVTWAPKPQNSESRVEEESGRESKSGSGTGIGAWVRKSKSRVDLGSEPESGLRTGDRVPNLGKSKSRVEMAMREGSGIADLVPRLRRSKSRAEVGVVMETGEGSNEGGPPLRKRKSSFMRMFS